MSWINATPQVFPSGAVFEKSSAVEPCVRHAFANTTRSQSGKLLSAVSDLIILICAYSGMRFAFFGTKIDTSSNDVRSASNRAQISHAKRSMPVRFRHKKFPLIRSFVINSSKTNRAYDFWRQIAVRRTISCILISNLRVVN